MGAASCGDRPPDQAVGVWGTVLTDRYPYAGMDVVTIWLDVGAWFYIGAQQLALGPYSVQRGDRMLLCIGRP